MAVSSKVATGNKNYNNIATQEYDPAYNQKVQGLKNQLAQNQMTLEQQKTGINNNFNSQVASQNLASKKTMNNISNTALGRGLQNSSIVTSGLGEANVINNRVVNEINTNRTGSLNDIDQQKALLAQNNEATLTGMSSDRLNEIATLARSLEDRDWDKGYKQVGLDLQLDQMLKDQEYKNKSLAQEKLINDNNLAWQKDSFGQNLAWEKDSFGQTLDWDKLNAAQQLAWSKESFNKNLDWDKESFGTNLDWEKQKLAQQLANSGSSGGGSGGSSGGSDSGNDPAYDAYLAKYSEIMSADATEAEKKSALKSLKTEMTTYSNRYGTNYNDIIDLINPSVVNSNGASYNSNKGVTKSTGNTSTTTKKTETKKEETKKTTAKSGNLITSTAKKVVNFFK